MTFRVVLAAAVASLPRVATADPIARACIAADEKGIELRRANKLHAAREQMIRCAAEGCPPDVRSECGKAASELTALMPSLVIAAQDSAGNDLTAVRVMIDGVAYADHLDGSAIPLDPGVHEVELEAAGEPTVHKTFVLREGEHARREVVRLEPRAQPRVRDSKRRAAGLVTIAVGAAGVGVGVVAGALAASFWSKSQTECATSSMCSSPMQAVADHNSAVDWATVSTASLIAGGVVLVLGGVLFFTAPWVTPTTGGLTLGVRL